MKKGKPTYSKEQIAGAVLCAIGCTFMAVSNFLSTQVDLFDVGLATNAIGLCIFIFGRKSNSASQ